MENLHLFAVAYAWQIGALVAVAFGGVGLHRYGRMLEGQTRERGARLER